MKRLVAFLVLAGCNAPTFGVPHSKADLCIADSASVCTALNGAHRCTDGKGDVCVLCWPRQRDQCPLDGVTSGDITDGPVGYYYICVDDCSECAQDPREKALGITCSASPPPTEPLPGPADMAN